MTVLGVDLQKSNARGETVLVPVPISVGPVNELKSPGIWVETGLGQSGQDFTIWIEDGL